MQRTLSSALIAEAYGTFDLAFLEPMAITLVAATLYKAIFGSKPE
ncbi:MAG: hypothetical protein OK441_03240 [Thaumarchaeota archaeon]|nr:hypothetical protein [Nitrososphaerota archaeon]